MKPILMVSPEICACAEAPNIVARATVQAGTSFFSFMVSPLTERGREKGSDAEVLVQACHARRQLGLAELLDDLAMLHDQEAIGERRGEAKVLLDHDDRVALLAQAAHDLAELLHDDRGEALGDLVEKEQARAGAQ